MYLPADAQDRLFEQITELSAAGSRIAAETVGTPPTTVAKSMRESFERIATQFGMQDALDVAELMYNDPDRADVAQWLGAHGWRGMAVTSAGRDAPTRPLGAAAPMSPAKTRSRRSSPARRADSRTARLRRSCPSCPAQPVG